MSETIEAARAEMIERLNSLQTSEHVWANVLKDCIGSIEWLLENEPIPYLQSGGSVILAALLVVQKAAELKAAEHVSTNDTPHQEPPPPDTETTT
jgi:hypothetical protein